MHALIHDLRFAVRSLRKRPVFSVVAILSITLGIGFNAAIFSGTNTLLLGGVEGVPASDEAVEIGRTRQGDGFDTFGWPDFRDLREGMDPLRYIAAWRSQGVSWGTGEGGELVPAMMVSADYFDVMGVRAARGRLFGPDADLRGGPSVAVVSHRFWQERLAGDPSVVGSTIDINRTPFTIIGVVEPGFTGHMPIFDVSLWTPIALAGLADPGIDPGIFEQRGSNWFHVVGRLAPGETVERADRAAKAVMARLAEEYPETNEHRGAAVLPLGPVPGAGRSLVAGFFGVLTGLVGLVLLVTAANVAGMLLARAASRRREIAIRLAMGSGRRRLVRQLTTEAVVLFIVGGGLGAGLAFASTRIMSGWTLPGPEPFTLDVTADTTVLLFALGLALVTGIVFGLVPALSASRPDLVPALKSEGRGGRAGSRLRRGFAAAQVGLSLVLLVAAGLFVRALQRAGDVDPGFEAAGVQVVSLDLGLDGYPEEEARAFQSRIVAALAARPGFEAVALSDDLPLDMASSGTAFWPEHFEDPEAAAIGTEFNVVSHGYFDALRILVHRGRGLAPTDRAGAQPVAVVNQALVDRAWPDGDALGRRIRFGGPEAEPRTVVGVVADVKNQFLGETVDPMVYVPVGQWGGTDRYVVARGPGVTPATLRAALLELDPRLTLGSVQSLQDIIGLGILPQKLAAWLALAMGGLALLLSALGVYGVIAYATVQRRQEMGIRMAVGATRESVVGLILRSGLGLALPGLAVGTLIALATSRVLRSLLFGVSPTDPVTFGAVIVTLALVVAVASAVPALKAARQNPVESLRSE